MPITKTGKSKDGKQQYRVRINYTDAAGKARAHCLRQGRGKADRAAVIVRLQGQALHDQASHYTTII